MRVSKVSALSMAPGYLNVSSMLDAILLGFSTFMLFRSKLDTPET